QAGLRTRVRMAKASLLGGADAPLLVVIRPAGGWAGMTPADRRTAERQLVEFIGSQDGFTSQVRSMMPAPR
ncbi:MAG: hypothetical protein AB7F35_02800, partial [Acetobacteraceae bacterium]